MVSLKRMAAAIGMTVLTYALFSVALRILFWSVPLPALLFSLVAFLVIATAIGAHYWRARKCFVAAGIWSGELLWIFTLVYFFFKVFGGAGMY